MKIVFLESLGLSVERIEDECKTLEALGHEVVIYADRCPEKNAERAADADIVVESNMPLHKDFFECKFYSMQHISLLALVIQLSWILKPLAYYIKQN